MKDFLLTNPELESKEPIGFLTLRNDRPFSLFSNYTDWYNDFILFKEELCDWVENNNKSISDELLSIAVRQNYCWYTGVRPLMLKAIKTEEDKRNMEGIISALNQLQNQLGRKLQETFAEKPFMICYRADDNSFGILRELPKNIIFVQVNV